MGERIHFKSNGSTAEGDLARPVQPGPGIVALAPDLFHGRATKSPDEAGKMMMSLRIDEAARDLDGAVAYLQGAPEVSGKIGTIGFCMGGALSLYAASRNPHVEACVVFYGGHPNVKPDQKALQAPVLGIFGEKDSFVSSAVVAELDRQLTALGKRHEFHTYPGTDHAFFNDHRPQVYNAAAAADAWSKTVEFFGRELRS